MKKSIQQRLLAGAIALCLVLGLVPGVELFPTASAAEASSGGPKDAFGIAMEAFTEEEKQKAEQNTPIGAGYDSWSSLLTKNELFLSTGSDSATQRTKLFDWNEADSASESNIKLEEVKDFSAVSRPYRFIETAAYNPGTGKDERVAQLGYNEAEKSLVLMLTDTSNNRTNEAKISMNGKNVTIKDTDLDHLSSLDTYQVPGAVALACGDFDGDGKDSIIVYVPATDGQTGTIVPYIYEYTLDESNRLVRVGDVVENLYKLLGYTFPKDVSNPDPRESPLVSLVAEDTDLDGIDELVITAGFNDSRGNSGENSGNGPAPLGSQLFVYELYQADGSTLSWHQSAAFDLTTSATGGDATNSGRIVRASSTVGNLVAGTSMTQADYPEILSVGYVDKSYANGWDFDIDRNNDWGYTVVTVNDDNGNRTGYSTGVSVKTGSTAKVQNVVCGYELTYRGTTASNTFSSSGFWEGEEIWGVLQVQAFADRGADSVESAFISGSVFRWDGETGKLTNAHTPTYFTQIDGIAAWSSTINDYLKQTVVLDVVAGNFDGNNAGREQILCLTGLEKSLAYYESYSQLFCIYNAGGRTETDGSLGKDDWKSDQSDYIAKAQRPFYATLTAVDSDDDSVIVQLKEVTRTYTEPDVLAILESTPYFAEIGDGDVGNSSTFYGLSETTGGSTGNSFGFNAGVVVGAEPPLLGTGGSWELSINNTFNWGFEHTTTTSLEWGFSNDTGENLVVVYRAPVVNYKYEDADGNAIVVSKPGTPAYSMITEEEYNEAVAQYPSADLTPIPAGMLGTPGDPASYRSSKTGLENFIPADGASGVESFTGWVQYNGGGTITQSITEEQEDVNTFDYNLDIDLQISGGLLGVSVGGQTGFHYEHETSSITGSAVTKSGAVMGQREDGYDFQWQFAAWNVTLNSTSVPVLGYLVQNVEAPPSPAINLNATNITSDSLTLTWDQGIRAAQEYNIYGVYDGKPALLGTVEGNVCEYQVNGLYENTPYTYVVRGVAYDANGDKAESVDSVSVTVTTRREDAAAVTVSLSGPNENDEIHSSGAMIRLSAATTGASGTTTYRWQLRRPGGMYNWQDLSAATEGIGDVTGTNGSRLTLQNVDISLDGGELRCVATVTTTGGGPTEYYSNPAKLVLGLEPTTTELDVEGQNAGKGTMGEPYTGFAGYTTSKTDQKEDSVDKPVTIAASGEQPELTVYSYAGDSDSDDSDQPGEPAAKPDPVYVGIGTSTAGDEESQVYYAVTKEGDNYAAGEALTLGKTTWRTTGEGGGTGETVETDYTVPGGFNGKTAVTEKDADDTTYQRMVLIEAGNTYKEYWLKLATTAEESTAKYYTKEQEGTFSEATDLTEAQKNALRTVYYSANDRLIVDYLEPAQSGEESADATTPGAGYDRYVSYTVSGNALTNGVLFWRVTDYNTLYQGQDPYALISALTQVTKQETVTQESVTTTTHNGTTLTLSANVTAGTTALTPTVTYTITNLSTGSTITLAGTAGTAVTWTANAAGLYRITAASVAAGTYAGSSATAYFEAAAVSQKADELEYRLVIRRNDQEIDSMTYDGNPVSLVLQSRTPAKPDGNGNIAAGTSAGNWMNVDDAGISFTATLNGADGPETVPDASSYIPNAAGTYLFTASRQDGTQDDAPVVVATAQLVVSRAAITVAPTWTGDVPAILSDIKPAVTDDTIDNFASTTDEALLTQAIGASCSLYDAAGALRSDATGLFDVVLQFKTGESGDPGVQAVEKLQAKYTVTFQSDTILRVANTITVDYSAGPNGTVSGMYSSGGSDIPLNSGGTVALGNGLAITATPNENFMVSQWTLTLGGEELELNGEALTDCCDILLVQNSNVQVLRIPSISALIHAAGKSEAETRPETLAVSVSFTNENHTVTYSVSGANGTLSAAQNGQTISSDTMVAAGSSVTFTAEPEEGVAVSGWTVNNKTVSNEDGTNFTGLVLTQTISADTNVAVTFTQAQPHKVTYEAVDSEGNPASGITLTAVSGEDEGENGSITVTTGSSVTFTAETSPGVTVLSWQVRRGTDGPFETVSESANTYTLNNVTADTAVQAVVNASSATSYTLNFDVVDETGSSVPDGGTLTAASGSAPITSGGSVVTSAKVDFTFTEADAYEVVKWTVNDSDVPDSDGLNAFSLADGLQADTEVQVVVQKKARVTEPSPSLNGGTAAVTYALDGESVEPKDGYLYTGTVITVTLTPEKGYAAANLTGFTMTDAGGSSDVRTATKTVAAGEVTAISPTFTALDTYRVTYNVVDQNSDGEGGYGTLAADVERKGMETYASEEDTTAGVSGVTTVYEDGAITLTAEAQAGYRVAEWRIGGDVYEENGSVLIADELTLTWAQLDAYAQGNSGNVPQITVKFESGDPLVTFSNPQNGTLTATVGGWNFSSGGAPATDVVFTVVPNPNYEVKQWLVNGDVVEGEKGTTFTYHPEGRNVNIAVELQGVVLDLTATAGTGGTVTVSPETVRFNERVTLTAQPGAGYAFDGWYQNGRKIETAGATYVFTATAAGAYEARFTPTTGHIVTFSVSDAAHGSISATADGRAIESGAELTGGQAIVFTVTPAEGYRVASWSGLPEGAAVSEDKAAATVPALSDSLTVQALLEAIPPRTITITPSTGGTITAQVDGENVTQVPDGTEVTFTATANAYWQFTGWTGDAQGQTAPSFTMEVNQDVTVGATFTANVSYTVTYSGSSGGSTVTGTADGQDITESVPVRQPGGSKLVFTASPASGRMVKAWTVNDQIVTEANMASLGVTMEHPLANTLTIGSLAETVTVTVEFERYVGYAIPAGQASYTITEVSRTPAETYSGAPGTEIRKGGDLTFTVGAEGASGYVILSKLTINGYNCLTETGTATNCTGVTAEENAKGTYTVTITGVSGEITTDIAA